MPTSHSQTAAQPPRAANGARTPSPTAGSRDNRTNRTNRANAVLSSLLACALSAACTPGYDACFDPAAVVRSPQVLAIRADPPEAIY